MANLGIFEINTNGEYENLATLTSLTFTAESKYNMQVFNKNAQLTCCVANTKPTIGGFLMGNGEKFSYTAVNGQNLWVCTSKNGNVLLNIAN